MRKVRAPYRLYRWIKSDLGNYEDSATEINRHLIYIGKGAKVQ